MGTTTKFHPILFSTPMVQAIQEDRKTKTRRTKGLEVINENPDEWRYNKTSLDAAGLFYQFIRKDNKLISKYIKCPYEVGDVLWVRESFHYIHDSENNDFLRYGYKADNDYLGAKWKPSIHMPKIACRTFLKIKSIRAERIFDISEEDSIAEGVEFEIIDNIKEYKNYTRKSKEFTRYNDYSFPNIPKLSFISLWESINGLEALEQNAFVWVYEFERIEKPNDFI